MRYRIVLCGFSELEYGAIHYSLVHPAAGHGSEFVVVDGLSEADFAVVDTDSSPAVKGVLRSGRVADSVFVGSQAPPGVSAHLGRPIDTARIARALDELIGHRHPVRPAVTPSIPDRADLPSLEDVVVPSPDFDMRSTMIHLEAALAPAARIDRTLEEGRAAGTGPISAQAPVHAAPQAPSSFAPDSPSAAAAQSAAKAAARAAARRARLASYRTNTPAGETVRDVLVLDSDEATSTHLCALLERFGFSAYAVRSIAQAGEHLSTRLYAAIFLDIELDGAGLALLEQIHSMPTIVGQVAPAVLLVTAHPDPTDRVRAALAGITPPLVKPLSRGDVARALEDCRVALPSDERRT